MSEIQAHKLLADYAEELGLHETAEVMRCLELELGKVYMIETVKYTYVGRVHFYSDVVILLKEASRVFDTGRFHNALKDGLEAQDQSEIEPVLGMVRIKQQAVVEIIEYQHNPPKAQK